MMNSKSTAISPETREILERMGEQIKLARLRRNLPVDFVAQQAGISRSTLWSVERGSSSVAIGSYAAVLHVLGKVEEDLLLIAKEDQYGRKLQDLELMRKRARERDIGKYEKREREL